MTVFLLWSPPGQQYDSPQLSDHHPPNRKGVTMRTSVSVGWIALLVCVCSGGAWSLSANAGVPELKRGSPRCSQSDPGSVTMIVAPGKALVECTPSEGGEDRRIRQLIDGDVIVDAAGIRSGGKGTAGTVAPLTNTV